VPLSRRGGASAAAASAALVAASASAAADPKLASAKGIRDPSQERERGRQNVSIEDVRRGLHREASQVTWHGYQTATLLLEPRHACTPADNMCTFIQRQSGVFDGIPWRESDPRSAHRSVNLESESQGEDHRPAATLSAHWQLPRVQIHSLPAF